MRREKEEKSAKERETVFESRRFDGVLYRQTVTEREREREREIREREREVEE